jgi:Flp pilus assembly protein TadG
MSDPRKSRKRCQRGQAILEASLMAPFIFLLFLGIFDVGFYSYAIICTANAARVAALYTSASDGTKADATGACGYALRELQALPNVGTSVTSCGVLPVTVTATAVASPDGDISATGSKVSVTYQTIQLFPLPWLTGQLQITRSATMRVKPS